MSCDFSVVIPTHARPAQLEGCLRALSRSGSRLEVLVVDDGGGLDLEDTLRPWRDSFAQLTLLCQEQAGPAQARNRGAAAARAPVLIFLDDDCWPEEGWLAGAALRLAENPGCAVGGRLVNGCPGNPWAETSQMIWDWFCASANADPERATFLGSGHLAVSTDGFRALGGFSGKYPQAAAEDRDFCDRWLASGRRLIYAPEITVRHVHALTFRSFVRQHYAYGRGARRLHRSRGARPAGSYRQLLTAPLTHLGGRRAGQLGLLLLLAQTAHLAGYVRESLA